MEWLAAPCVAIDAPAQHRERTPSPQGGFPLSPRALSLPACLQPQLRHLLAAVRRRRVLYGVVLDEHGRQLLDRLLAELPAPRAPLPYREPQQDPGRILAEAAQEGTEQLKTIPASGASCLGGASGWVQAALRSSALLAQQHRVPLPPPPPPSPSRQQRPQPQPGPQGQGPPPTGSPTGAGPGQPAEASACLKHGGGPDTTADAEAGAPIPPATPGGGPLGSRTKAAPPASPGLEGLGPGTDAVLGSRGVPTEGVFGDGGAERAETEGEGGWWWIPAGPGPSADVGVGQAGGDCTGGPCDGDPVHGGAAREAAGGAAEEAAGPASPPPAKRPRTDPSAVAPEVGGRAPQGPATTAAVADAAAVGGAAAAGAACVRTLAGPAAWAELAEILKRAADPAAAGASSLPWERLESALEQCAGLGLGPGPDGPNAGPGADCGGGLPPLLAAPLAPDAVHRIVRQLVTARLGGGAARLLLASVALPAVAAVERAMPKPLLDALACAAACHPRPLAEAVLAPAARRPGLSANGAQLLVRAATAGAAPLPGPLQALVLRAVAGAGPDWGEPHVNLAHKLLEAAEEGLDGESLTALARGAVAAQRSQPPLGRSVVYCRLLLALSSRHAGTGQGLGPAGRGLAAAEVRALQEAAAATNTFLTKPTLAKLAEALAAAVAAV
ncbi:hypothetical protein HYH03_006257 [Edaphochlamys debaryana]|uniref:Fanconi Anaemia group E protein C-terminal domain-containing protein n=1 Tax=Edaphochlamys debaryana TaxID=47281 RepID=A0A836C190_9CHLO|nr:hypothetical protein HYH03_006257 [Edaphochlamys debaryana]|eukprot:KAG2495657.1 hypothetical protein HYH03_006257 [Edaphochlamys debaryana]